MSDISRLTQSSVPHLSVQKTEVNQSLRSAEAASAPVSRGSVSEDLLSQSVPMSTPIAPVSLMGPSSGLVIGLKALQPITLGALYGSANSEKEAIQMAHDQWGVFGDSDFAITKSAAGYQVYQLDMNSGFLGLPDDMDSYSDLRGVSILPDTGDFEIIALVSDDDSARFFAGQKSAVYAQSAPMSPLLKNDGLYAQNAPAVVDSLFDSVAVSLDRLKAMENDLSAKQDHRGVFASLYRVITERGDADARQMQAAGDLRGAEFTLNLIHHFADRYFDAYDAYVAGDMENVPEVWRSAFDSGRNAQAMGYGGAAITEVISLSMVAHIINDLPQTLQDMGYPQAEDKAYLTEVFDRFNGALMDEKENIMGTLKRHYGGTDTHFLDTLGCVVGCSNRDDLEKVVFTEMRTIARDRAQTQDTASIQEKALSLSDLVRSFTPGGN